VKDRILVALDPRDQARRLLHEGWRVAHALRAPLFAITVSAPPIPGGQRTSVTEASMATYARMAEDLGAEVIQAPGVDIAEAIARVVRERHITLVIVGAPDQSQGWLRGRPSVANRLLRLKLNASILVVPCQSEG
jgi:K+-sensing histidine kinase KdpD